MTKSAVINQLNRKVLCEITRVFVSFESRNYKECIGKKLRVKKWVITRKICVVQSIHYKNHV